MQVWKHLNKLRIRGRSSRTGCLEIILTKVFYVEKIFCKHIKLYWRFKIKNYFFLTRTNKNVLSCVDTNKVFKNIFLHDSMWSFTGPLQKCRMQISIALTAMTLQNVIMGKFLIWLLNVLGGLAVTVAPAMLIVRNHH